MERMDYIGEVDHPKKKPQPLDHHHHRFAVTAAQILFSVSIFWAVFFLYSPEFYIRLKLCFAAYTVESLSYNSNKNYMFLLCNGILVVLVKNSGLINSSYSSSSSLPQSHAHPSAKPVGEENAAGSLPEMDTRNVAAVAGLGIQEQGDAEASVEIEIREGDEVERDGNSGETEAEIFVTNNDEEDIEEEEEEDEMSREELNRKCEDFIKKMRGEIYFEFN
ncbi:uncharacterized protein LOC116212852 [Punica granatum]|uniref:Uncharacterized protein LOC116212852 n=2 Tax=Punica granatum TaxID=22663 RepID=A0A6P8EA62_PUNGR|nr:uncharacterized protein LOC116212852 [Punica granatum]PKI76872.1 hypothetical protein CRG98_002858 [Punica granatum]